MLIENIAGFVSLSPQGDAGDAHDDREPPNRGAQPRADGAAGVRAAGEGGAGGQGARPPGEDDPRLQPAAQTQQKVPPIVSTYSRRELKVLFESLLVPRRVRLLLHVVSSSFYPNGR